MRINLRDPYHVFLDNIFGIERPTFNTDWRKEGQNIILEALKYFDGLLEVRINLHDSYQVL